MGTSKEEKEALEVLKKNIEKLKDNAFEQLRLIVFEGGEFYKCCGYKSIEDATIKIIKGFEKDANKLDTAFEKRFPGI